MDENKKTLFRLGQKIKYFRERAGISQFDLEVKIGASQGSLSRIENGIVNPSKETLIKIIDTMNLGVFDAAEIFGIERIDSLSGNGFMDNLYKITSEVKILQEFSNNVQKSLGLHGIMTFTTDDEYVYSRTITQTWYFKVILKILGKTIDSHKCTLSDNENAVVRSINSRKAIKCRHVREFAKNVVPEKISDLIEKVSKTRSALIFPLLYDGRPLGAVLYSQNDYSDFKGDEKLLGLLTDFLAVTLISFRRWGEINKAFKGILHE